MRRWASAAILFAGIIDLLDAITPPLRGRLHVVLEFLPLRASEAAGALIAMAGLALVALGRGILRGQRRAWRVAVVLLSVTIVLHLVAGADFEESLVALAVLILLLTHRRDFQSASDWSSLRSALIALGVGLVGHHPAHHGLHRAVHPHQPAPPPHHIPWWTALRAVSERLVGIQTIALPHRADRFLAPALLAIGLTLVAIALFLLTRPVVDRRLSSGRAAEFRARDIVRRHGISTLDYFALRSDKKWFFHRDSLVAYAVYGGVCLISPDPIGPRNEREQVWGAFRRFADSHGWVTSVMGAGEDWLPVYRDSGMHNIYLGDEAVVRVQSFTLAGRRHEGPAPGPQPDQEVRLHRHLPRSGPSGPRRCPKELTALMSLSRQGEHERGFSMMLGRVFDPRDTGLLLTVVRGPDGSAAAMCQFVPAPGINGYSLDLMRRDPADHPNGLLDFALCLDHRAPAAGGYEGLSLNFAALRSTLSGDKGDGTVQRAERWFLKRLSNFAQIESLWRFNAKYDPEWLPRYVVFDTAEHLVPVTMAIMRAESLWEIPVLGRLLAAGAEKRTVAAQHETEEFIASLGPWDEDAGPASMTRTVAGDGRSPNRQPERRAPAPASPANRSDSDRRAPRWPNRRQPAQSAITAPAPDLAAAGGREADGVWERDHSPAGHGTGHPAQTPADRTGTRRRPARRTARPASRSVVCSMASRRARPRPARGGPRPTGPGPPAGPGPPPTRRPTNPGWPGTSAGDALGSGEGHQRLTAVEAGGDQSWRHVRHPGVHAARCRPATAPPPGRRRRRDRGWH